MHGGSGLEWTREEVMDLPVDEALWYLRRVKQQRTAEAKAIKDAQRQGGK